MKEPILVLLVITIIIGISIFIPHYYQSKEKKLAAKWYKIGVTIGFECSLDTFKHFDKNSPDPENMIEMVKFFNQCERRKLEALK